MWKWAFITVLMFFVLPIAMAVVVLHVMHNANGTTVLSSTVESIMQPIQRSNANNSVLSAQATQPTPVPTTKPVQYVQQVPQIECIGPDGVHFKTTQKDCDDLNNAWGNKPKPTPEANTAYQNRINNLNNQIAENSDPVIDCYIAGSVYRYTISKCKVEMQTYYAKQSSDIQAKINTNNAAINAIQVQPTINVIVPVAKTTICYSAPKSCLKLGWNGVCDQWESGPSQTCITP